MQLKTSLTATALASAIALASTPPAMAASHSDAPLIKQDPQANITDVYAFMGTRYDDQKQEVLNVIVHVRPFSEPGDGVIYDRFADDALYSIHITDPNTGDTQLRYDFQFSEVSANPSRFRPGGDYSNRDTILSYGLGTEVGPIIDVGDNRQNYVQTYSVASSVGRKTHRIGRDLITPPPNVGLRTTPAYNDAYTGLAVSGATEFAALDTYTQQTVHELPSGEVVFAGPREDGFFADTPGIFDLLDARIVNNNLGNGLGQDGDGVDGFKGYNVLAYAIQVPLHTLNPTSYLAPFADLDHAGNGLPAVAQATGVGVYASVSRPRVTLRSPFQGTHSFGGWVQVNRMGNPLFNEVLVALDDKVKSSGWPNERRLGDDVVDIALTAVASGPSYSAVTLVGDNIAKNDQDYHQVFPYSATPHAVRPIARILESARGAGTRLLANGLITSFLRTTRATHGRHPQPSLASHRRSPRCLPMTKSSR